MWKAINDGSTHSSEGGIIIRDEVYKGCRITLERCEKYCAITCGCSAFLHTAFCNHAIAEQRYEEMKQDLKGFIDVENPEKDVDMFYEYFTNKY